MASFLGRENLNSGALSSWKVRISYRAASASYTRNWKACMLINEPCSCIFLPSFGTQTQSSRQASMSKNVKMSRGAATVSALRRKFETHSLEITSVHNMGVFGAIARHLDTLIGPGVMLLFPLYASMRAIESPSTLDDQQWLTYWVLYSLITLFELSCWKFLAWFPVWPYLKLLFCIWLVLPIFNGAAYIYGNFVRKYVKIGGYVNPNYPESQRKVLQMMSLDARRSVEHYIEKNGPDAFDRVLKAAEREARKKKH